MVAPRNLEGLRAYITTYFHGEIPDFTDEDWDQLAGEFGEGEYQAYPPEYLVAYQRASKRFEEIARVVCRKAFLYVQRESDGYFTMANWEEACAAAWKEEERLGHYDPFFYRRYSPYRKL